ncbi:uncharacterized protein LOC118756438, partial [Rhagoletis pomonella]|uniref:uncharacterized protein LOC118756438 n=1 Tax=Rhagoletis pomonella TaxID=28610 RepID=UPI0017815933
FLTGRRSLLCQYWEKYVKIYDEVSNAADDASTIELAQLALDAYNEIERIYTETLGELNDMIEATSSPIITKSPTIPATAAYPVHSLPPIKLPPFDGSFLRWYPFKDLFTSIVIKNRNLSDTQRLQYLKDSLIGEAKNSLDNIATTDGNFTVAWCLLERKFDNKRIIINAHLTEITNLQPIRRESAANLRSLIDSVTASLRALEQLGRPVAHWDDWLIYTVVHKLDSASVRAWELSISSNNTLPTFDDLRIFIENQTKSLEVVQSFADSKPSNLQSKDTTTTKSKQHGLKGYHTTEASCPCCSSKHYILFCTDFRNQTPQQRYKTVQQASLCMNCLRSGHKAHQCSSKRRCQKCNSAHHTMIHEYCANNQPTPPATMKSSSASNQSPISTYNASITQQTSSVVPPVLLGTALVELHSNTGHTMVLRALLDSGAEATFISEYVVSQLKLSKSPLRIPLNGANGQRLATTTGSVEFSLRSTISTFEMRCTALVLPRVGNLSPSVNYHPEHFKPFWDLKLADPKFNISGAIDVILSAGDYATIMLNDIKRSPNTNVIAQNTQLGWVIFGSLPERGNSSMKAAYDCYCTRLEVDVLLRRFWEQEEVAVQQTLTKDEIFCNEFFESTTQRTETGRYVVRLPVKNESGLSQLSSTREAALSLLSTMERRLNRDASVRKLYHDFMSEYYKLGHMELVGNDRLNGRVSYLPHHSVLKDSSTTTKLRVVFNASKRSGSGLSLNECLHTGPKLQKDLASVVLNWRKYRIAFTADIEKMYRQILVHGEDVDLQRIVWRFGDGESTSTFRLLTVTYGTNCAPFLAMKVLQALARDEQQQFPHACSTLLNEFYVDDVLSGAGTIFEANQLRGELQQLLLAGGFKLRKWNSNSTDMLQEIDPEDRGDKDPYELNTETESKALGIVWMTHSD